MNDSFPNNVELIFTTIHEDPASITFNPPLKIDCWLIKDDDGDRINLNFDFGLSRDFGINPFYIKDLPLDDWVGRAKRIVEFELFHSFISGFPLDPNYGVLNWALFGNLAHRVICKEGICANDSEVWTYNQKLEKVFTDNHYNLKFT